MVDGQVVYFGRPSGAEHHSGKLEDLLGLRLAVLVAAFDDLVDLLLEPHIEHLVCFVHNQHGKAVQVQDPGVNEVDQTTRSRD